MKHKVFLIIGTTATGKTSLVNEVCKRLNLSILKSYITRPMRDGETVENSDHIFVSSEDVESYADRMIAYTDTVDEYERFATIDQLMQADFYIINPDGVNYLKTNKQFAEMNNIELIEIYISVPLLQAVERAEKRGDTKESFIHRYNCEFEEFLEYEKSQSCHYHILNDDFTKACDDLERIVKKELNING